MLAAISREAEARAKTLADETSEYLGETRLLPGGPLPEVNADPGPPTPDHNAGAPRPIRIENKLEAVRHQAVDLQGSSRF
jgi:hypothetical protein